MMRLLLSACLALLSLPACAGAVLDRIGQSSQLTLGYLEDQPPFSSGAESAPQGYAIELCQRIARLVKQQPGLEQVNVQFVRLDRDAAEAAVQQGKVDLLCSAVVDTLQRRRQVNFSLPIYPGGRGVAVSRNVSPRLEQLLQGNNIGENLPQWRASINRGLTTGRFVVLRGSLTEEWVRSRLAMYQVLSEVTTVEDYAAGLALLNQGKADALFGDRVVLHNLIAANPEQAGLRVLERIFELEPAALAMPRGDDDFRLLVDSELSDAYRSGEIIYLYQNYFGEPGELIRQLFQSYARP